MKKYKTYKDSGIEWIGAIPIQWTLAKLKYYFRVSSGDMLPMEKQIEDGYPVYGGNGLRGYADKYNTEGKTILIGRVGAKCGNVHVVDGKYWVSEHALKVIPIRELELDYFKYLIEAIDLNKFANTTAQPLINSTIVTDRFSPIPSNEEQTAIAKYLDKKTKAIDKLNKEKEKLLEKLKQKRQAIINEAVTKGITANVEMKDSGIEWLGQIPKHWEVKKLKYLTTVNSDSLSESTDKNYCFKYIDIGNVTSDGRIASLQTVVFKEAPSRARRKVKKGVTIFSTVRTYLKAIAFIDSSEIDLIASTGFAAIEANSKISEEFLFYVLKNDKFIDRVCALSTGVSYPAINSSELSSIEIVYPIDKNEQNNIVNFIKTEFSKTLEVEALVIDQINKIKKFRQSLISEVVTGKRKVV